jgi:hypothetical protein
MRLRAVQRGHLRLELNRWRQPVRDDDKIKALKAAGAAAAKR